MCKLINIYTGIYIYIRLFFHFFFGSQQHTTPIQSLYAEGGIVGDRLWSVERTTFGKECECGYLYITPAPRYRLN